MEEQAVLRNVNIRELNSDVHIPHFDLCQGVLCHREVYTILYYTILYYTILF